MIALGATTRAGYAVIELDVIPLRALVVVVIDLAVRLALGVEGIYLSHRYGSFAGCIRSRALDRRLKV